MPRFSPLMSRYSSSNVADRKRCFRLSHITAVAPTTQLIARLTIMTFLNVSFQLQQNISDPSTTAANTTVPVRDRVSRTASAVDASADQKRKRSAFEVTDVAPATSNGAMMQRYIERLFG